MLPFRSFYVALLTKLVVALCLLQLLQDASCAINQHNPGSCENGCVFNY